MVIRGRDPPGPIGGFSHRIGAKIRCLVRIRWWVLWWGLVVMEGSRRPENWTENRRKTPRKLSHRPGQGEPDRFPPSPFTSFPFLVSLPVGHSLLSLVPIGQCPSSFLSFIFHLHRPTFLPFNLGHTRNFPDLKCFFFNKTSLPVRILIKELRCTRPH